MCSTGRMCLSPSFKVVQDGGNRHRRDGQDNHEFAMIEVRVVFDGRMMFDSVETERVSEVVGIVYHEFAHGMARTTVSLSGGGGGDDLDAVQGILAGNGTGVEGLSKNLPTERIRLADHLRLEKDSEAMGSDVEPRLRGEMSL